MEVEYPDPMSGRGRISRSHVWGGGYTTMLPTPHSIKQTHTCENVTFPKLRLRAVIRQLNFGANGSVTHSAWSMERITDRYIGLNSTSCVCAFNTLFFGSLNYHALPENQMLNFLTRIDEREADWSSIFPDHVNKHQTWGWSHRTNKIQKKKIQSLQTF